MWQRLHPSGIPVHDWNGSRLPRGIHSGERAAGMLSPEGRKAEMLSTASHAKCQSVGLGCLAQGSHGGSSIKQGCSVISAILLNTWPLSQVLWRLWVCTKISFHAISVCICAYTYMHMHIHACVLHSSLGVRSRMRLAQEVLRERIYISSLMKQVPALTQRPHLGPYVIFDTITSGATMTSN